MTHPPTRLHEVCLCLWGQCKTLAEGFLNIMPSVLAAWLLWMPWICTPLPLVIAGLVVCLASTSLLFWSDALPLLPRTLRQPPRSAPMSDARCPAPMPVRLRTREKKKDAAGQ